MQPIASTHGKLLVWGLDASRPRRNCGNCRSVASRASDGAPDRGVFGQDFSMRWPNLVPCCVYRHWRGTYGLDDVAAKGRMPMSRALRKNLSAVGRGNKRSRICLAILPAAVLGLNACGDQATLPASAGFGPSPQLPPAHATLIPTVNIAPATGWQGGTSPVAAPGLRVVAFAEGLDHPRWLYVLPNGDVLVAETNAPPKPEDGKGIKGWIMRLMMGRAGAGTPSANRITLLRDSNRAGVAQFRSVFLEGLNSPFGMALVGDDLYIANTDAVVRYPYHINQTQITSPGVKVVDLPAGPINHHWTKNIIASADGRHLYVTIGSNSNAGENGKDVEAGRADIWEIDPRTGQHRVFASGLRNPVVWLGIPRQARCGRRSTSAMKSAATSFLTT